MRLGETRTCSLRVSRQMEGRFVVPHTGSIQAAGDTSSTREQRSPARHGSALRCRGGRSCLHRRLLRQVTSCFFPSSFTKDLARVTIHVHTDARCPGSPWRRAGAARGLPPRHSRGAWPRRPAGENAGLRDTAGPARHSSAKGRLSSDQKDTRKRHGN